MTGVLCKVAESIVSRLITLACLHTTQFWNPSPQNGVAPTNCMPAFYPVLEPATLKLRNLTNLRPQYLFMGTDLVACSHWPASTLMSAIALLRTSAAQKSAICKALLIDRTSSTTCWWGITKIQLAALQTLPMLLHQISAQMLHDI